MSKPPPVSYLLYVNGERFEVPLPQLTVNQIRALASIAPQFELMIEGVGSKPDLQLGLNDQIDLSHGAVVLFARPPTMFGMARSMSE